MGSQGWPWRWGSWSEHPFTRTVLGRSDSTWAALLGRADSTLARGKEATACWHLPLALMASILCFFFFFFTAKTKGHGEQTYQVEIFRRRCGKRNWPKGYSHDQGVPWCSPWASRVLLKILWVFKVGKKEITSLGFWTPSLSTRTSGTLKLVWSLAFGREDAQLFRRFCLPVGVPSWGLPPSASLLPLLMNLHWVSGTWAQHVWKALSPLLFCWGECAKGLWQDAFPTFL